MTEWTPFFTVFTVATGFFCVAAGLWCGLTLLRNRRFGPHGGCRDKVRFRGEELKCPACELRELQGQVDGCRSGNEKTACGGG